MSKNALAVSGLTKRYKGFVLSDISFSVPQGSIVGLVGENGAGKTTTLNAILGLVRRDGGDVSILGSPCAELPPAIKEQIGVVFGGLNFSEELTPQRLDRVMGGIYSSWDRAYFSALLKGLGLPAARRIKTYSKGMKAKLSLAVAFAHHPKLLLLDEATSGLDPVVRDDILDMFLDFVQDEEKSILVSSHITSDLEKVADHIVFIHEGRLVFSKPKDELLENYGILKCGAAQFDALDRQDVIAWRKQDYEWQVLVADRQKAAKRYPKALVTPAALDEIMLLYVKGETR